MIMKITDNFFIWYPLLMAACMTVADTINLIRERRGRK
jgi:hypothetical protein